MNKIKAFQLYFYIMSIASFFWWTMGHWVYPDWYHKVLGFQSYDLSMAQIIGTLSLFAVFGMYFVARNPTGNRDYFISLLVISVLMSGTYLYLILTGQFPQAEYINIALLLVNLTLASILYPWQEARVYI